MGYMYFYIYNIMQINPKDILETINKVRENPNIALNEIKDQLKKFQSNSVYRNKKDLKVRTLTGKAGWQDTVLALERQKAKGPLTWNSLLFKASEEYKEVAKENNNISPFEVIKSFCSYEGNISFNINESDVEQDLIELISTMVVGDGDEKKGSRVAIFHPLYRQFACSIRKTGNKNIIYTVFAQSVEERTQKNAKNSEESRHTGWEQNKSSHQNNEIGTPTKYRSEKVHQTKEDYFKKGKQLIGLLNKVRKEPKQFVHVLKSELQKFKDEKTLVAEYGTIITKDGQAPYYDLISELQSQYPLPTIREVTGLSLVALQQVIEAESMIEYKVPVQSLLDKFCISSEGVRSLKLKDINGIPTEALLLSLLVGDGDRKKAARRKMLSPICKAMGCCIGKNVLVANVGETAKDNVQFVQQYMENIYDKVEVGSPKREVGKFKEEQESPRFQYKSEENFGNNSGRVVVKKSMRSHFEKRGGRSYKITNISLIYDDGKCEQIVEEDLVH